MEKCSAICYIYSKKLLQKCNYSRYRHYYYDYNYQRVSCSSNVWQAIKQVNFSGLFFEHNEVATMNNLWAGLEGHSFKLHSGAVVFSTDCALPPLADKLGCMLKYPSAPECLWRTQGVQAAEKVIKWPPVSQHWITETNKVQKKKKKITQQKHNMEPVRMNLRVCSQRLRWELQDERVRIDIFFIYRCDGN